MQVLADRYEVVRELGRGAFGHTYLARDREHGRDVAIKVFDPKAASDWKAQELFEREAGVLRALRHHGVPEIFDYRRTEEDGTTVALLVMEYIEGQSLQQLIDSRVLLDQERVMHLLLELLSVLEYLHSRVPPILHRDIKPSNIIIRSDGTPVLLDFGSVRRVFLREDESGSTIAGTYGYMPYEQYMGQATPSSDLYSLGATMLHVITGRAPREFIGDAGAIDVPALPGDARIAGVLQRMLRSSPAQRFASAREVKQAIIGASAIALQPTAVRRVSTAMSPTVVTLSEQRPRKIEGELRQVLAAGTPSMLGSLGGNTSRRQRAGVSEVLLVGFMGVLTMGILPLVQFAYVRSRRRRLAHFLRNGIEATATIRVITSEATSLGEKVSRVGYDFTVDGGLHRGADTVPLAVGERWAPGDTINVIYIPEEDYESAIVSLRAR